MKSLGVKSKKRKRPTSSSATNHNKAGSPKLPPEIVAQLSEVWDKKARNNKNKGSLPTSLARTLLTEDLGLEVHEKEVPDDDRMDRDTVFQFAGPRLIQKQQATRAFHCFDTNGKGLVVREDVELIAAKLGESLDAEEVDEMMEMIDPSGEGLLTVADFVRLAKEVGL